MGSGIETVTAEQICDCNVPEGSHTYAVSFKTRYDEGEFSEATFDSTIEVMPPSALAGIDTETETENGETSGTEEEMPWSEPEPEVVQGLDCIAACKNGGPGTEAAAEKAADQDSGCAVILVAAEDLDMSPLALLLFGFVPILLLRREKRS
jgi:hypothetical protein